MSELNENRPTMSPRTIVAKHLQEKGKEWSDVMNKAKPLQLLSLPLDVLQAIIREVTHTNDLTALALTHSVLHALVIPYIYSRFDIVWPDAGPTIESRVGVDALTYGLATLVMSQDVFGEGSHEQNSMLCSTCGGFNLCQHRVASKQVRRTRRGNHFAQFTRKFSLGNGPEDWVKEYLITKEGGKMLGTLVALAVGRMRNLESFTWDMPTGILRDVWLALGSLGNRGDGYECQLNRVWVRWHDNQDTLTSPPLPGTQSGVAGLPHLLPATGIPSFHIPPYPRVEFPTFSVLPPLKSLTVLDVDELSYVEEMSVLTERSLHQLRELRVGLAHHARSRAWARPREDRSLVPPSLSHAVNHLPRKGGLLGILVSRFCPAFNDAVYELDQTRNSITQVEPAHAEPGPIKNDTQAKSEEQMSSSNPDDINQLSTILSEQHLDNETLQNSSITHSSSRPDGSVAYPTSALPRRASESSHDCLKDDNNKLVLEVLELERVYMSMSVLSQAFDWTRMRTLTILSCLDHENLWKALRKQFTPPLQGRSMSISKSLTPGNSHPDRYSASTVLPASSGTEYKLCLTRIHTDAVSPSLLAFLKDTLAPDTLEYLFLQQSPTYKSPIAIDQIYKHAVRRHRLSLRKLLIDSDIRAVDGSPGGTANWRRWAVSRELITCITSGRMQLRELSMSIDYKDWHYFLQRLPNASSLRSLHIKNITDYVHNRIDAREAAHQVLDIVTLRPEMQLCYLGIQGKCFEILEYPGNRKAPPTPQEALESISQSNVDDDDVSDDHDEHEHHIDDDNSDDLNLITDEEDGDDSEDEIQQGRQRIALRLREILFYDDKISIFKARHGRL